MDIAQKIKGAGVQLKDSEGLCDASLINKSNQFSHPKKTEHAMTRPSELIITDMIGPSGPK